MFPQMVMTYETKKTIVVAMALLVVSLGTPLAYADPTSHGCMNDNNPNLGHCYTRAIAQWCFITCGDREESGLKGSNIIPSTLPSTQTSHWTANPFWVTFPDNDWVEVGWIKGGGGPCGTETTAEHYQIRVEGGSLTSYCLSASAGTDNYELSDTNKDKQWHLIVNSNTRTSDQDYDKGKLLTGGESIHSSNAMDGFVSGLQYYDTQWRNWDNARTQVDPNYGFDWCTQPTSFEYGDNPSC